MKTPGVYIVEKNAFPNSVVEVATAVPAFIGYTKSAKDGNKSLINKPWKISSLAEFEQYYGGAPAPKFTVAEDTAEEGSEAVLGASSLLIGDKRYAVTRNDEYNFYYQMRFFFANGGGPCYIVAVNKDGYTAEGKIKKDDLMGGVGTLLKEQEPTMVLVPEAVYLDTAQDCFDVQVAVLQHCGRDMRNRVAIFDVYDGFKERDAEGNSNVTNFREQIGTEFLDFGSAYYPWLNTSVVQANEITFMNIAEDNRDGFKALLTAENDASDKTDKAKAELAEYITKLGNETGTDQEIFVARDVAHKILMRQSKVYSEIMREMLLTLNMLPPASAMAGIYTLVDHTKEVWKAPANISMANVISPTVSITHADQENLNVPLDGKAVNAIRYFVGEGVKVWGARTLDGNSLDWRYINVRRTMIMLEESIKNSAKAFVFEPNVANTWVSMRSMISNFLNGIWKRGGLAGAIPEDAFSVHVGLGDTMTSEDILEGILRITVLVAISRPAEFIEITFQQQMQKS